MPLVFVIIALYSLVFLWLTLFFSGGAGVVVGMRTLQALGDRRGTPRLARAAKWAAAILLGMPAAAGVLSILQRMLGFGLAGDLWPGPPLAPRGLLVATVGSIELALTIALLAPPFVGVRGPSTGVEIDRRHRALRKTMVALWSAAFVAAATSMLLPAHVASTQPLACIVHAALACAWAVIAGIVAHEVIVPGASSTPPMRRAHAWIAGVAIAVAGIHAWLTLV